MSETSEPTQPAVLTERRDRVLVITLNRPEAMNAINGDLSNGLWSAIQDLNNDPGLTAGVLTGNGRGFCAGMDLKAFSRGEDIGQMVKFIRAGSEKPLICAIEGFALAAGAVVRPPGGGQRCEARDSRGRRWSSGGRSGPFPPTGPGRLRQGHGDGHHC